MLGFWQYPNSTTVSIGQQTMFSCNGDGSYIYWFIDGVNYETIASEELKKRGISLSGNHSLIPYRDSCGTQYSNLIIEGNCYNNQTEVYCMLLGDRYPYNFTSPIATLTVQGK